MSDMAERKLSLIAIYANPKTPKNPLCQEKRTKININKNMKVGAVVQHFAA